MLNKVLLIGRLGADPELKYGSNGGSAICRMRIATDDSYVDREGQRVDRTEWHTVVAFNRTAENCSNFLGKGSLVYVEGTLNTRKWEDANGQPRYTTEVRAQRVLFLDRKGEGQYSQAEDSQGGYSGRGAYGQSRRQAPVEEEGPWEEETPAPRQQGGKYAGGGNRSAGQRGNAQNYNKRPPQYDDGDSNMQGGREGHAPQGGSESAMDEVPF